MPCTLYDRQHQGTPAHSGLAVESGEVLEASLESFSDEIPFIAELISPNDEKILIGVGGPVSFVQHSDKKGNPPYLCALANPAIPSTDM